MKIIKQVDPAMWSVRTVCNICDSELEITIDDIKSKYIDGDRNEPGYDNYYIFCPVCSVKINILNDKITKGIRVKIRKHGE